MESILVTDCKSGREGGKDDSRHLDWDEYKKGGPLYVGGTLVLPLEWRRLCRGNSGFAARV